MACKCISNLILGIVNLVYFVAGAAMVTLGAIALASPSILVDILTFIPKIDDMSKVVDLSGVAIVPAICLTAVGSVVIVLCIIGCMGAMRRHNCLTTIYGLLTLLLMLWSLAFIMFYAIDPYVIQPTVEDSMRSQLQSNYTPVTFNSSDAVILPEDESSKAWVKMEFEQACCGVSGPEDYKNLNFNWTNDVGGSYGLVVIPPSCCMQIIQHGTPVTSDEFISTGFRTCLNGSASYEYTNYKGCSSYVMQQVTRYNFIYVCASAGLVGLQAIIIALSMRQVTNHKGDHD